MFYFEYPSISEFLLALPHAEPTTVAVVFRLEGSIIRCGLQMRPDRGTVTWGGPIYRGRLAAWPADTRRVLRVSFPALSNALWNMDPGSVITFKRRTASEYVEITGRSAASGANIAIVPVYVHCRKKRDAVVLLPGATIVDDAERVRRFLLFARIANCQIK